MDLTLNQTIGNPHEDRNMVRDTVILGSGPAGLTAALYAARANLKPLVITGSELGGQIATTTDVENFPGFPEGLMGPELVEKMQAQAERFGAEVTIDTVQQVDLSQRPFRLTGHSSDYYAKSGVLPPALRRASWSVPGEPEVCEAGAIRLLRHLR